MSFDHFHHEMIARGVASETLDVIRKCTQQLSDKERLIIILYYYEEMTMKEIGATLDLSESRVSQMHSAIVKKMRTMHKRIRYEL